MKTIKLTLIALCTLASVSSFSQATMKLINFTNCDLIYSMTEVDISTCAVQSTTNYNVPPGSSITVNAQPGNEWNYVIVSQNAICPVGGSAVLHIGSNPSLGCTACPAPFPPFDGSSTYGCASCQRGIDGDWFSCAGEIIIQ